MDNITLDLKAVYVDPDTGELLRRGEDRLVSTSSAFPIVNGVVRFVSTAGIASNWSRQWDRWKRLHAIGREEAAKKFAQKFGFDPFDPLCPSRTILDAGCGSGRNLLAFSGSQHYVWAVDLSDSVDVALENANAPNIEIAQADLAKLPFPDGFFDFIFSDGVLIHVPDLQVAVASLSRKVKPGGSMFLAMAKEISADQRNLFRREQIINLYRLVTTKITDERTILKIVNLLSGLYKYHNTRILRRLVWYLCPELNEDEEWRKCYIHDYLTAKIRKRQKVETIVGILNGLGLQDISVFPSHEVRVLCRKPALN